MLLELSNSHFIGVLHLASAKAITKYQFAKKICDIFGFDDSLVKKGSIKNGNLLAKRPLNTSLCNKLARKILKTKPLSVDEGILRYKNH